VSPIWIAVSALQWVVIATLCLVVLSLVRQLGVVMIRLNPSAGLDYDDGPGPGTELPAQEFELFPRGSVDVGGSRLHPQLIVFLSPDCSICTSVAGYVRALARDYDGDLDLVIVVQGTPRLVREFVETHGLEGLDVGLRQNFPPSAWAPSSTPFGVAITSEGTVAARGTPNALEHLEQMIDIAERARGLDADTAPVEHAWGDSLPAARDEPAPANSPSVNVVMTGGSNNDSRD
jgi:methylamine dehydrogenase accessory protein MauD